jgi:hypothetical protein
MTDEFSVKLTRRGEDTWTLRIESTKGPDGPPFAVMNFNASSPEAADAFAHKAASGIVGHPVTLTHGDIHAMPTETTD